jgi:hypothetical protein
VECIPQVYQVGFAVGNRQIEEAHSVGNEMRDATTGCAMRDAKTGCEMRDAA